MNGVPEKLERIAAGFKGVPCHQCLFIQTEREIDMTHIHQNYRAIKFQVPSLYTPQIGSART
jgi:hypothetical protein